MRALRTLSPACLLVLACTSAGPPPAGEVTAPVRLVLPPGPSDPWREAKAAVLTIINDTRRASGLQPFAYDDLLERVGQAYCQILVDEEGSHVARDGTPPYLRYLLAGGRGFHRENVGSFESTAAIRDGEVSQIAGALTAEMLDEQPPNDGHRQTLLDPTSTQIGIGITVKGGRLRLTHEVACQIASSWAPPPLQARPLTAVRLAGGLPRPWRITAIEVLWEPLPEPRGANAPAVRVYRYPPRRAIAFGRSYIPEGWLPSGETGGLDISLTGSFSFAWRTGAEPGVEILVVWATPSGAAADPVPIGATATVVTADARLPANLAQWADLRGRDLSAH